LFDRVGETVDVSEEAMDAVTAVAGSGPAYVYLFMEALIEARGLQSSSRTGPSSAGSILPGDRVRSCVCPRPCA